MKREEQGGKKASCCEVAIDSSIVLRNVTCEKPLLRFRPKMGGQFWKQIAAVSHLCDIPSRDTLIILPVCDMFSPSNQLGKAVRSDKSFDCVLIDALFGVAVG